MRKLVLAFLILLFPMQSWAFEDSWNEYAALRTKSMSSPNLIEKKVVYSPVSEINFTGLNGASDVCYKLELAMPVNTSECSGPSLFVIINNDTNDPAYLVSLYFDGGEVIGAEVLIYNINKFVSWYSQYFSPAGVMGRGNWKGSGYVSSITLKLKCDIYSDSGHYVDFPPRTVVSLYRNFD